MSDKQARTDKKITVKIFFNDRFWPRSRNERLSCRPETCEEGMHWDPEETHEVGGRQTNSLFPAARQHFDSQLFRTTGWEQGFKWVSIVFQFLLYIFKGFKWVLYFFMAVSSSFMGTKFTCYGAYDIWLV